eukprot:s672_g15.t1
MVCSRRRLGATLWHLAPGALLRVKLPQVLVQGAVEEPTMDPNSQIRSIPHRHMLTTGRGTWGHDLCPCVR